MPKAKTLGRTLVIALLILLQACTAQREQLASQSLGTILLGLLFALLALGVILVAIYLEQRWQLLRLLRLQRLLRRIPGVGPYISQGMVLRGRARRADEYQQRIGRAATHDSSQMRGEESGQSRYKRSFIQDAKRQSGKLMKREAAGEKRGWWRNPLARREAAPISTVPDSAPQQRAPAEAVPLNGQPPSSAPPTTVVSEPELHIGRFPVSSEFIFDLGGASQENQEQIVGRRIDRYQVDALLGEDEVSAAFQAYDLKLGRQVRLQVIRPEIAGDSETQARLLQNVRIAAAIEHPLIGVYDYDTAQDHLYIVSEYINGVAVNRYIEQLEAHGKRVSTTLRLETIAEAADALAHVHKQGILHGGLTPRRIIFENMPGQAHQVKIADLSVAQFYPAAPLPIQSVWPYLAPEQWQGGKVDGRADIYALGTILYQITTGKLPFDVKSYDEARAAHTTRAPLAPSQVRPTLSPAIEKIIIKAMAKDPAQRFQTGREFADALRKTARELNDTTEDTAALTATTEQCIVVTAEGEPSRIVPLDRAVLHIGSANSNDLVLPGKGVAAEHVQIEVVSGGWEVIDLGTASGTRLNDAYLLPDVPEYWGPQQPLQIGSYRLVLQNLGNVTVASEADTGLIVDLDLIPLNAAVVPGQRVDFQISLRNRGSRVDRFTLEIAGIPASWVALSNNRIELMPNGEGFLLLTVAPPRDSTARAGSYRFGVTAHSAASSGNSKRVEGELHVAPFENLVTDLYPEHLFNRATTQLTMENQGNIDLRCELTGHDSEDALQFVIDLEGEAFALAAGEKRSVDVQVEPLKRPWWGLARQIPFEIVANTQSGTSYGAAGQLERTPLVPSWVLSLAAIALMLLCLLSVVLAGLLPNGGEALPPTAMPEALIFPDSEVAVATATTVPLPNTCAAIKMQNEGSAEEFVDGEYTLYIDHNPDWPFQIYCHNMDTRPVEYLTLPFLQSDINYSVVAYPDRELVTLYSRVRIDPRTLTIDRTDREFATIVGNIPETYAPPTQDFGSAMGCSDEAGGGVFGRGNIDLSSTPFIIHSDVAFKLYGKEAFGTVDISDNRSRVNIRVTGLCGWVWPSGDLQLQYLSSVEN